jgi:ATP-dependent DNA ligase
MYAQRGSGKRSSFYSDFTFGCWDGDPDAGADLLPVGKAYFGFTDAELKWLDSHVRQHTVNRFGPVRETDRSLVLEVAFDPSTLPSATSRASPCASRASAASAPTSPRTRPTGWTR